MKQLRLSRDGTRLVLVLPSILPLRAAARQIRGCHHEGTVEGSAVFSFPYDADVCSDIMLAFDPEVAKEALGAVNDLQSMREALNQAESLKEKEQELIFDPLLCTEPMEQQVRGMNFCISRIAAGANYAALLMEQGTGKSLVTVGLANHLHAQGLIKWVMVVAPNHLKGTWGADDGEVIIHTEGEPKVRILRGSRDKRQAYLRRLLAKETDSLLWIVTNYEEFAYDINKRTPAATRFQGTLDIISAAPPGMFVADESGEVKNPNALTTNAITTLSKKFDYRMILNGTPVECSPLDVFSQFEILEPGCLGFNTALSFDRAYARRQRISVRTRGGGTRFVSTITGYSNLDDLNRRLSRVSFRALAKDCLDLPPVTARTLPVELSAEQGRILRELKSDMMAEHGDFLIDGRNILTRYQKMAQVLGGFVKCMDSDGVDAGWKALKSNPFLDAIEGYMKTAMLDPQRKVVIFAEHPATEIEALSEMCERNGWNPVSFHGGVKEDERDLRRQRFKDDPECRVLIVQWECGSKGLNLTVADTILFYGLTFKYGTWAQARKRVDRKGQTRPVTEVYLLGLAPPARGNRMKKTLSHVQLEALRNKQNLADVVTGDSMKSMLAAL